MDFHRKTKVGKAIYKRHKETLERSFADAKQLHGQRYIHAEIITCSGAVFAVSCLPEHEEEGFVAVQTREK